MYSKTLNEMLSSVNLRPDQYTGKVFYRTKDSLFDHTAIYVGKDKNNTRWLIENNNPKGISWVRYEDFSLNQQVTYQNPNLPEFIVIKRAFEQLRNRTSYSLFKYNCQHFTNWAAHGRIESEDLQQFATAGLLIAGLSFLLAKSGKR